METALLLIDLQRDFLAEDGRMPVGWEDARHVIVAANRLIRFQEKRGWLIIDVFSKFKKYNIIGNYFRKNAAIEGSEGCREDPRIHEHGASCFPKKKNSAFSNPYLAAYLQHKEIEDIVICGVFAETSIRATALDARHAGLNVTVISDGIASSKESACAEALADMRKRGIRVLSLEEYLQS